MKKLIINSIIITSLVANGSLLALAQEVDLTSSPQVDSVKSAVRYKAVETREAVKTEAQKLRDVEERSSDVMRAKTTEVKEAASERVGEIREAAKMQVDAARDIAREQKAEFSKKAAENRTELKTKMEERRKDAEERRVELKTKLEERKAEVEKKREEQKTEFKEKLQKVRDEKKKQALERLDKKFYDLNQKLANHWLDALKRFEELLVKLSARADKAETAGRDVSATRTAVQRANAAIGVAQVALENQLAKTYVFEVPEQEGELRSEADKPRVALARDLNALKQGEIRAAHQAVVDAITALKGVPDADKVNDSGEVENSDDKDGNNSN